VPRICPTSAYIFTPKKSSDVAGDGVWLKPYGGSEYVDGSGFITSSNPEDSPVAKIPLLGRYFLGSSR